MNDLVVGKTYTVTEPINACLYNENSLDCEFPDMVDLPSGTELIYVRPDDDPGGYVFVSGDGTEYCLHDDDLVSLT